MLSNASALAGARKHLWALIFFVLFASRQKGQKKKQSANTAEVLVSVQ